MMQDLILIDLILTFGGVFFAIALLPSVIGRSKPSLGTSILMGVILLAYCWAYDKLDLHFAAATTAVTAILWFVLAIQKGGKNGR